jgi:hypothetical protein
MLMRGRAGRATGQLAPAVASVAALVLHALAASRLDDRAPTEGEARLAAGAFAARSGEFGTASLPFPDLLAARQLAVLTELVPAGASVWETARAGALVLGLVSALLVWPVLRRLGCGAVPTAVAVAVVGVIPPAVALHTAVTAAAVAVPWLLVAAVLYSAGRLRSLAAVAAAVLAVLTAPLLGAVPLALAAHWFADRTVTRTASRWRRLALALVLGVAAVGVGVAAGTGPLAGGAAAPIPASSAVAGAVVGLVVVGAGWRVLWVRPLLTPAVLLLAVLLAPGPGRGAAALTALPLLAVITAAVAEDVGAWLPARVRRALRQVPAQVGAAAIALAVLLLPPNRPAADPPPASLQVWLDEQLGPGAALHADALDRAELVAAGFPRKRLRAVGDPAGDLDAVLVTARPQAGSPSRCPTGSLLATLPRWGGGPAELCATDGGAAATTAAAERASRVRVGTALAGNPALRLDPGAADLLAAGQVDTRVMIVLVALAGSHTLSVADFPHAELEPPDALRRCMLITTVDGARADTSRALHDWLAGQHAPFQPAVVRPDEAGLLVGYRVPSPPGLLPS